MFSGLSETKAHQVREIPFQSLRRTMKQSSVSHWARRRLGSPKPSRPWWGSHSCAQSGHGGWRWMCSHLSILFRNSKQPQMKQKWDGLPEATESNWVACIQGALCSNQWKQDSPRHGEGELLCGCTDSTGSPCLHLPSMPVTNSGQNLDHNLCTGPSGAETPVVRVPHRLCLAVPLPQRLWCKCDCGSAKRGSCFFPFSSRSSQGLSYRGAT